MVEGSPIVGELKALEEKGVHLGTRLDYFGLKDQPVIGEVRGMAAILGTMMEAEKVLSA